MTTLAPNRPRDDNMAAILRPSGRPIVAQPSTMRSKLQREAIRNRTMDAIAALTANAQGHGARVFVAKQIVKYGAVCLAHALGLQLTAAFLASLAGQIDREADAMEGKR